MVARLIVLGVVALAVAFSPLLWPSGPAWGEDDGSTTTSEPVTTTTLAPSTTTTTTTTTVPEPVPAPSPSVPPDGRDGALMATLMFVAFGVGFVTVRFV